ncbi:transcription elongation factor Elf1 like-domain-containing protein [Gamsiella multidivaricata]|uniref:transcription elongation factor Elf1 like-domain-containing protein n=1 Tax=Gamsiella multidivaricata TaxID=101098 RepID=UPI00221F8A00|nr:transcription elongation factor Elf1 like-domain-containing protein [Gamsiella multidivaricata]KAG0370074.1 hypothetical protein BGZ54_007793 [Gamsiella multidivaricata]KAI7824737.1 transcription elongation factor Elf1 like-domain-containing protein [Gamsiella multidivaricata]
MGKRKSSRKPQAKVKKVLDTQFDCVACFHEKSINCKLDFDQKVGHLQCRMCGVSYTCAINYLSHAVDVYHDWIDACEAVNTAGKAAKSAAQDRNRDRDRDRDRVRDDRDDDRPRRSKPYDRYDDDDD